MSQGDKVHPDHLDFPVSRDLTEYEDLLETEGLQDPKGCQVLKDLKDLLVQMVLPDNKDL